MRWAPEARLAAVADAVRALAGWRRSLTAAAAGAVSILAMAPFHAWPVLLLTLPVLAWLIEGARGAGGGQAAQGPISRRGVLAAAGVGWWFGFGFHVPGLYWLREAFMVTGGWLASLWPLGVIGLPAYLALFHGLAAGSAAAVPGRPMRRLLALALALAATEWLRGHLFTGFPWNVLGLALTYPLVLAQSAVWLGIYGLTIVTVLSLASPAVLLAQSATRPRRDTGRCRLAAAALVMGPLAAMAGFGAVRLSAPPPAMADGVRIRLVQPSIPQRDKWQADKQTEFLRRHLELTLKGPDGRHDGLAGITHVVWPEAALPFLPLQRAEVLDAIGGALPDGVHLLLGVLRMERRAPDDVHVFNSLAALGDDGRPVAIYDKTHLVPFGEYLPFPEVLEAIGLQALTRQRGGFATGITPRPLLHVPGLPPAAPLICYEAVFPGAAVQSKARPALLVNVTNDGWFGNSTGPRQHLHQARLRAVEEGLPLIRVANNGITAVFDAHGRELRRLDLDVAGVIDTGLPGALPPPFYARHGDLGFLAILLAGLGALWLWRGRVSQ